MTIQELARQYADWFETATRDNDTDFIRLKTEDENITQLIRDAHGDYMPCDYKYQFIHDALEAIAETDDIDDITMEPDCYNRDLLNWVSSNLKRASYVDEAIVNMIDNGSHASFYNLLMIGQAAEMDEVLYSVRASLDALCEGMNDE